MDIESPFATFSTIKALQGSGGRNVCIMFCSQCFAHWLCPVKPEQCVKCAAENPELLKEYQTKVIKV